MDSEFDPRRSDVHRRSFTVRTSSADASRVEPGPRAGSHVPSPDGIRRWTPLVRRHAMRIADKCAHAVGVAELTEVGLVGLIEAVAVLGRCASDPDADADLELAVLGAMRSHLLARSVAGDAARRLAAAVTCAMTGLGPTAVVLRASRTTIVGQLGWTMHDYEQALLAIGQAGLARVDATMSGSRGDEVGPRHGGLSFEEALAGLSDDDRALIALLYVRGLDLATAAVRLGRSPREVEVDHVEIVHRLRVAVVRA